MYKDLDQPWLGVDHRSRWSSPGGGGFKYFSCSTRSLGKWSSLTSIFCRWVETTNQLLYSRLQGGVRFWFFFLLKVYADKRQLVFLLPCFSEAFSAMFPQPRSQNCQTKAKDFWSQVSSAKHRVAMIKLYLYGHWEKNPLLCWFTYWFTKDFQGMIVSAFYFWRISIAYFRNPMMKLTRIFVAPVISSCFSSHHYLLFRKQWEFLYLKRKRQRIWWFYWWDANEMGITRKFSGSFMLRDFFQVFWNLEVWFFSSILP